MCREIRMQNVFWQLESCSMTLLKQGLHKPEMLRGVSEHGKLRKFYASLGKNCNEQNSVT